jgi:ferredoxin-like protein FixX
MERDRNHGVDCRRAAFCDAAREERPEDARYRDLSAVFQSMYQLDERKFVAIRNERCVECGPPCDTVATGDSGRR